MDKETSAGKGFLEIDSLPEQLRGNARANLKQGQIMIHNSQSSGSPGGPSVPGGLVHDWTGIVFIPGVSLPQTLGLLQDYNRDQDYYRPEVLQSRLIESSQNEYRVFLRLKKTHVVTVVLDTEYDVHYFHLDPARAYSRSYSTRIQEVEDPGSAKEYIRPTGDDHGYLWRLYSYWRFYEADGGTYIQCEAISLTRDVPYGVGWLVNPFIQSIPTESLRFTLEATRTALLNRYSKSSVPAAASPKSEARK